jgi:hypothetical protein
VPLSPVLVAGIPVPFHDPAILGIVGVHVLAGLACVVSGILAMFSRKGPGLHAAYGNSYFLAYTVIFFTTSILSFARWHEDYYLFAIGSAGYAAAFIAKLAAVKKRENWKTFHIIGMGTSFMLLLTAFYMDNGRNLPVWKDLPHYMYWLLPNAAGIPVIIYALIRYGKK